MHTPRSLLNQAVEAWKKKDTDKAVNLLKKAWGQLADPVYEQAESYPITRTMTLVLLESLYDDEALEWAERLQYCASEGADEGDAEFIKGQVHWERKEWEEAEKSLIDAFHKSDGKRFKGEHGKYLEFIKEKVKGDEAQILADKLTQADEALFSGDLEKAVLLLSNLLNKDGLGNPYVHLRKGQAHYELEEYDKAAEELVTAYLMDGEEIFEGEAPKYLTFVHEQEGLKADDPDSFPSEN